MMSQRRKGQESEFDAIITRLCTERRNRNVSQTGSRNRKRKRTRSLVLITLIITVLASVSVFSAQDYLWRFPSPNPASSHKAALIDELSVNFEDPYFINNVTGSLKQAGYTVDYYAPDRTTVGLFRELASKNYGLVIVRSHTGGGQSIVTSEPYSQTTHDYEQLIDRVGAGTIAGANYFTITPLFVRHEMQGRLPDSIVVLMGCSSLNIGNEMAQAFLDRGAGFIVGWNGVVTAAHTDLETMALVDSIAQGKTVPAAVSIASTPDPVYNSQLAYLEWSTVAQQRWTSLLAEIAPGLALATLLVFGPLTVLAIPKLLSGRR